MKMSHFLAEGILGFAGGYQVVVVERLLENVGAESHLLGKSFARVETLHKTTADVMLAVPLDLVGGLPVEDQADRILKERRFRSTFNIQCTTRKHTLPLSQIRPVT